MEGPLIPIFLRRGAGDSLTWLFAARDAARRVIANGHPETPIALADSASRPSEIVMQAPPRELAAFVEEQLAALLPEGAAR